MRVFSAKKPENAEGKKVCDGNYDNYSFSNFGTAMV